MTLKELYYRVEVPQDWYDWVLINKDKMTVQSIQKLLKANDLSEEVIKALLDLVEQENPAQEVMSDDWKEWIAINLRRGVTLDSLKKTLMNRGFANHLIDNELMNAIIKNNQLVLNQIKKILAKREWLMATCDALAALDSSYNKTIDTIDTPDFDYFIKHYYSKHLPVVLKGGIDKWPALNKWTPQYFAENFGDKLVEVQTNRESSELFERHSHKFSQTMLMSEYVDLIENGGETNDYYMTANNSHSNVDSIKSAFNDLGDFGEGYRKLTDDPTFNTYFWMGPKGTFTPLHHDLTNNMLIQIYGKKKVTLIPALQVANMYNDSHVFSKLASPEADLSDYPLMSNTTPIEVVIDAGDALFIPIAWWHCVSGLEDSISISFTNFNAPNNFGRAFKEIGA